MEFLRFGSSIPGGYWGCCAVCIIQNFKFDPDQKASIQLVSGDGGGALTVGTEMAYAGPTYREIFETRMRIGTFNLRDKPNHAFLAVLTDSQIQSGWGKQWLAILKEHGFEFIRSVDNSVYNGETLDDGKDNHPHLNHLFGLFRNIGKGSAPDPLSPPKAWTDLESVMPEPWSYLSGKDRKDIANEQKAKQRVFWEARAPTKILKESDIVAAGAPLILAGLRKAGAAPCEKHIREAADKVAEPKAQVSLKAASPCPVPV